MRRKTPFWVAVAMLALAWHPVAAQDEIPETSGFSGFVLAGVGNFSVGSNLLVRGTPILDDVGDSRVDSIFDAPPSNSSMGVFASGEVSYTFSGTRTQLFFGNRLEDLLRLDLVFGVGVRQEIRGAGIVAASALITPAELTFWADPYVEGEDRRATDLNFPGWRLRWGEIFGTGLEFTVTDRYYKFDEESSGDWLISENRLDPDDQPLLDRNGDILRIQALYRFDVKKRHRFEPAVRWVDDDHDGAAIATTGYSLRLTYLYRSPKVVLDANVVYGSRQANETNPIYGTLLEGERWAAAFTAFIPVKRFTSSVLNLAVGAEVFQEDANIDFYDSSIDMVFAGVLWRHIKK